jgi:hypothetical protein
MIVVSDDRRPHVGAALQFARGSRFFDTRDKARRVVPECVTPTMPPKGRLASPGERRNIEWSSAEATTGA